MRDGGARDLHRAMPGLESAPGIARRLGMGSKDVAVATNGGRGEPGYGASVEPFP